MDRLAVVVMGSKVDLKHAQKIAKGLEEFGVPCELRIASAHKSTRYLLDMVKGYERSGKQIVYIAVAGRSNALGGVIDANTNSPVINCPPYGDKFAGLDILSSVRMPGGVAGATVLEPEAAALMAVKLFALRDSELRAKLVQYQDELRRKILQDDEELKEKGCSTG